MWRENVRNRLEIGYEPGTELGSGAVLVNMRGSGNKIFLCWAREPRKFPGPHNLTSRREWRVAAHSGPAPEGRAARPRYSSLNSRSHCRTRWVQQSRPARESVAYEVGRNTPDCPTRR